MGEGRLIVAVPKQDIEGLWPVIKPFIDRVLEYTFGEYIAEDVKDKAINGNVVFFIVQIDGEIKSVLSTELIETPYKKYLNIITTSGDDFNEWGEDTLNTLINVAKEQGAEDITIVGRKGWLRKMKQYGFKHKYTALTLTL